EGGKVVVCLANLTKDNMVERKLGIEECLEETAGNADTGDESASYEVVDWLMDEGDREHCREQLIEFLTNHEDVTCVVGLNAFHGGEMVAAVEEIGRNDCVKIIAFDAEDATLDALAKGNI